MHFSIAQESRQKPADDVGLFLGSSFYIGDLNNFSNFITLVKPAGGIFYRYNFNPRFSLRTNAFYGIVEGNDAKSASALQKQRNLSFRSNIIEASGQIEFNYLEYKLGSDNYTSSYYLFLGLGAFWFDPKASMNGSWVRLQPLATEGKSYRRIQLSLPLGMGAKFTLTKKIGIAFETGMRKTFTDYLDDVSTTYANPTQLSATAAQFADRSINPNPETINTGRQRGNSRNKDWYSYTGIALSFKLKEKEQPCPTYLQ